MIGEDHLHIIEKGGPSIEPCGTPYFNVPASEKTSIQTKNFVSKIGLNPFNYRCPETKIFHFFRENSMV